MFDARINSGYRGAFVLDNLPIVSSGSGGKAGGKDGAGGKVRRNNGAGGKFWRQRWRWRHSSGGKDGAGGKAGGSNGAGGKDGAGGIDLGQSLAAWRQSWRHQWRWRHSLAAETDS
eukprot:gene16528-biopygen13150